MRTSGDSSTPPVRATGAAVPLPEPLPDPAAGAGAETAAGVAPRRLRRRAGAATAGFADPGQRGADRHGLAGLHQDLQQHPVVRAGDLRIHLVGRHLEQRVVELDGVAGLLQPGADGALGDGLAQLRHGDVVHHAGRRGQVAVLVGRSLGAAHLRRRRIAERRPPAAASLCEVDGSRFSDDPPAAACRRAARSARAACRPARSRPMRPGSPAITPSYGLGISESTLSVDTSNSGSSNATASPTCFQPVGELALGDRLAQLGHGDDPLVVRHCSRLAQSRFDVQPCRERPEKVIMVSPIASDRLGCAWISRPTSPGSASQLTAR